MSRNISFRSLKKSDIKALSSIIYKTWGFERFASKSTAELAGIILLLGCLSNQNFTCVAQKDGCPIGIIIVRHLATRGITLKYMNVMVKTLLKFVVKKDNKNLIKWQEIQSKINKKLIKQTNKSYDSTVEFFVVDENARGLGVGKLLFEKAVAYMKSKNTDEFYLFTDTWCSYGFYEHQGMKRNGSIFIEGFPDDNGTGYFLYEMKL